MAAPDPVSRQVDKSPPDLDGAVVASVKGSECYTVYH